MSRLHQSGIVVGRKGTGKSTYLNNLAEQYAKSTGRRVLIYDVNGSPAYSKHQKLSKAQFKYWCENGLKGIKRFYLGDENDREAFTIIRNYFKDGLLIMEDCTKYINANPQPYVKPLLVDNRMWGADIIYTFHSIKRVPPFFWEMSSYLTIFKTNEVLRENDRKWEDRIVNWEGVYAARQKVLKNKDPYYSVTIETGV